MRGSTQEKVSTIGQDKQSFKSQFWTNENALPALKMSKKWHHVSVFLLFFISLVHFSNWISELIKYDPSTYLRIDVNFYLQTLKAVSLCKYLCTTIIWNFGPQFQQISVLPTHSTLNSLEEIDYFSTESKTLPQYS